MLKFHVQEYERCLHYIMPACSKVCGYHMDQTFAIIDVSGEYVVLHLLSQMPLSHQMIPVSKFRHLPTDHTFCQSMCSSCSPSSACLADMGRFGLVHWGCNRLVYERHENLGRLMQVWG